MQRTTVTIPFMLLGILFNICLVAYFRKRNASVRAESYDDGIRETIKNILPVLDNFERALATSDGSDVRHVGHGRNHIHIKLAVQTFLNNLHVKQSQKTATESEAQSQ